jgi:hypothetical protein
MTDPLLLNLTPSIETERHLVRVPQAGDGLALHTAVAESRPELRQFLGFLPWVASEPTPEFSEARCRKGAAQLAVSAMTRAIGKRKAGERKFRSPAQAGTWVRRWGTWNTHGHTRIERGSQRLLRLLLAGCTDSRCLSYSSCSSSYRKSSVPHDPQRSPILGACRPRGGKGFGRSPRFREC